MFSLPVRYENMREIPYPYKGMLAISSDAEYTSQEILDWLITYLNTTENTPLGRGLGLEFAASLFFYSDNPCHTSMYEGLSADSKDTQYAHKLREYIKEGLIDTNHAFGDFNVENNFTRSHALRVYEMLEKYDLQIPIFTNHGNGSMDSMQHNVGFLSHHFGSDPASSFYHTDLFRSRGGKFVWTDDWVYEKFPYLSLNKGSVLCDDGRQPAGGGGFYTSFIARILITYFSADIDPLG